MPYEISPAPAALFARWRILRMVALALAVWGASAAQAEKADRDKPMHIEADAMRYEDARNGQPQTATFTGHVVVTKGTIVMRGDQLVVHQDAAGNQSGVMTPAPGQRAFFHQKREGVNEFIEGEADRMEYDSKSDTVHLIRNAEMRRLAGTAMADDVTGDLIVYNDNTEVYTVDRAPATTASGKPGRVHAIMVPQSAASGAGAAAGGSGAAGAKKSGKSGSGSGPGTAPASAVPLQATSTLPSSAGGQP